VRRRTTMAYRATATSAELNLDARFYQVLVHDFAASDCLPAYRYQRANGGGPAFWDRETGFSAFPGPPMFWSSGRRYPPRTGTGFRGLRCIPRRTPKFRGGSSVFWNRRDPLTGSGVSLVSSGNPDPSLRIEQIEEPGEFRRIQAISFITPPPGADL